LLGKTREAP